MLTLDHNQNKILSSGTRCSKIALLTLTLLFISGCGFRQWLTPTVSTDQSPEVKTTPDTAESDDASLPGVTRISVTSCLSIREQSAQLIASLLTPRELLKAKPLVATGDLGFIALVGKHKKDVGQALADLQEVAPIPLIIASDEESATVQRLASAIEPLPSVADLLSMPTDEIRKLFKRYGTSMVELGVTINFAPIVDVGFGPGIGTRSLGETPELVVTTARAIAQGLRDAGVLPVFKHFPGHGSASADSHKTLPVTRDFTLMAPDIAPYQQLLDAPAGVMVGHLLVPGLSSQEPTSLSSRTIDKLLRTHLNFDGLVFTDALNMGAITDSYSTEEAVIKAINAGADVVMVAGYSSVRSLLDTMMVAVADNRLSAERITHSASKVLALKDFTCQKDTGLMPTALRSE